VNKNQVFIRNCLFLLLAILLVLISNNGLTATQQQAKQMTLYEAIALALRYNRTVESAYLGRIIEKFNLKVAQDDFYPHLSVSASIYQAHTNRKDTLTTNIGSELSLKIPTGGEFELAWKQSVIEPWNIPADGATSDLTLSFRQPLLKGGGVDVNMASQVIAMRQEQTNIQNLKETLIRTITDVIHTYRNFLLAKRSLEISRLSVERSQNFLQRFKALIEAGREAQVDIIQTETSLANQELSYYRNENALDNARISLLRLLDIDRHSLIEPVELLEVKEVYLDAEQLQQIAYDNQPAYLKALLAHENANTNLLLARNNKLWELDIITHYNITGTSDSWLEAQKQAGYLDRGDYSVGLSLRIPFGDLKLKQSVLAAKVAREQSQINLQELKENIKIDIQDAVRDIDIKWEEVRLAQRVRELSKKQLEAELEKFKVGRSSNFRIVSFQGELVGAENGEVGAKINYLNAITDLDVLLGISLERRGINIKNVRNVQLP